MKLLVTAYGIYVAHAMVAGGQYLDEDVRDQIALWSILSLRWPSLAEHLENTLMISIKLAKAKSMTLMNQLKALLKMKML
jgi:hypothetical protein